MRVIFIKDEFVDENSYYSNYYDREDFSKRKRNKKQILTNVQSSIKIDARWSSDKIEYPFDSQTLYVAVSRGLKPILNATVKAYVYRPSGDHVEIRKNYLVLTENPEEEFWV